MFMWELGEESPVQGQGNCSQLGEGSQKHREERLGRGGLPTASKATGYQEGRHRVGTEVLAGWVWAAKEEVVVGTAELGMSTMRKEKLKEGRISGIWTKQPRSFPGQSRNMSSTGQSRNLRPMGLLFRSFSFWGPEEAFL